MPRYDRHSDRSGASLIRPSRSEAPSGSAIFKAAEALRETELEAARPEATGTEGRSKSDDLESMSVDELRGLATELDIPNRAQITEQDELIAAIRQRL
jgi:hypothetical protein